MSRPIIDESIIEQCNLLSDIPEDAQSMLIGYAIDLLEGHDISSGVIEVASVLGISNPNKVSKIVTSFSTLVWECAKVISNLNNLIRDTSLLSAVLVQLGINEAILPPFCKEFVGNRRRITELKSSLGFDVLSYKDLVWRLDVEISKRSLLNTIEPTFQLRLDLNRHSVPRALRDQTTTDSNSTSIESETLQCSYANLKNLQSELQKAIDAYTGVHSQRITRYIS